MIILLLIEAYSILTIFTLNLYFIPKFKYFDYFLSNPNYILLVINKKNIGLLIFYTSYE